MGNELNVKIKILEARQIVGRYDARIICPQTASNI